MNVDGGDNERDLVGEYIAVEVVLAISLSLVGTISFGATMVGPSRIIACRY